MRALAKRLRALEGGRNSDYDLWTDAQLIDRYNEITLQLRVFGFDFPLLDGGTDDGDRLRATQDILHATAYR